MSIDIDWPRLTTGPEGAELAASIRDFIHNKFQQVELPRFIRSVQVHSFDFGSVCPSVEIKDFGDPWPEFYEDEEGSSSSSTGEEEEGRLQGQDELNGASDRAKEEHIPDHFRRPGQTPFSVPNGPPQSSKPSQINTDHPAPDHPKPTPNTPFLSRSNTPGIPGGTSNLSYFHLPLSAGLNSGTQTPLAAAFGASSLEQHNRSQSPVRGGRAAHNPFHLSSKWHTSPTSPHSPAAASTALHGLSFSEQPHPTTSPPSSDSTNEHDRTLDLQTTLHTTYNGPLSLSLTAEILLDYPMPSFVGIPLALKITGVSFDGVALVVYVGAREREREGRNGARKGSGEMDGQGEGEEDGGEGGERGRCHFCFLNPEDARVVVSHGSQGAGPAGDGAGAGVSDADSKQNDNNNSNNNNNKGGLGGLLREIRVETEIGRQENGKQVLKNVGKVEKFVLEQVRRIFEEEFVWPSFWTFLV